MPQQNRVSEQFAEVHATKEKHERAAQLYADGRYADASTALQEALSEEATSELANDWAAAELACGRVGKAEEGLSARWRSTRTIFKRPRISALCWPALAAPGKRFPISTKLRFMLMRSSA